jgi:hypothetical protein
MICNNSKNAKNSTTLMSGVFGGTTDYDVIVDDSD